MDVNDEQAWSSYVGPVAVSGIPVSADTAMRSSAVWACVRLIAESMATMPLIVYRYIDENRRERARQNPLYDILHRQPNEKQTAFEFIEMMTGHVLLRGNAYAQIVPGRRGVVDQLVPLHPDKVTPEKLKDGAIRYRYRNDDGREDILNDVDIFHLRGLSSDGLMGMSVIEYARESIGLSLAAERYGGRFFGNDSRPGGILKSPKGLNEKAAAKLKESWETAHTGANQHRVAVLEEGIEWQQIGLAPEDSQFLETREFQVADIARWFRVPLHMIQETSKSTSWGTGMEQQQIGYVIFTLLPWARRWEQSINKDLILYPGAYYAEYLLDALIRGDQKSRYDAYAVGRNWGWLSVNDIRRMENMNPVEGGDQYLRPLNMVDASLSAVAEPPPTERTGGNAHYRVLLLEAAGRVVRKEQAAMSRVAKRCADDSEAWERAVNEFYVDHGAFVSWTMGISQADGRTYAEQQRASLSISGPAGVSMLGEATIAHLVKLAEGNMDHV